MLNDLLDVFYQAHGRRDAEGVAAVLGSQATYVDPFTSSPLGGAALVEHLRRFVGAFSELRVSRTRTIVDGTGAAVVWRLEGTCDGALDLERKAHGVATRLEGIDVFDLAADGTVLGVRRTFDRRALADALALQTVVEPFADGSMTFGYSLRDWASKEKPGVLGMTWILARDAAEKAVIRGHARQIVHHFRETPGFIGIVTGFAGLHGFTLTAWESEQALKKATHEGAHREAMKAFEQGLSGGVFTSVWEPLRLNRMWTRCPDGHANDATRAEGVCERCGKPLPERQPYL